MEVIAAAAAVTLSGILAMVLWAISRVPAVIKALQQSPDATLTPKVAAIEVALKGLQDRVDALPTIWQDYADRAEKSEKRAAYHARRAREIESQGDPEPEPVDVPGGHGAGGEANGMPSLFDNVAEDPRLAELRRRVALM